MHLSDMTHENEESPVPRDVVPVDGTVAPAPAANPLTVIAPAVPLLVNAEMLVVGLRGLQQRIPEYTQLTVAEERAMVRAASLDEEFRRAGIQAISVWPLAKVAIGWTAEELRREEEEGHRWDEVERELRVILKGVSAANLKRRYRVGTAILRAYKMLRAIAESQLMNYVELLPYFEEMKRAYANALGRRKRKPSP
jgi:hypothetical protein